MAMSDADYMRVWSKIDDHEGDLKRITARQDAFDVRLITLATELATQRGWIYLSIGLSIVTLVLLVVVLFVVVQLATYFRVLP
jgi:hypothetical protein